MAIQPRISATPRRSAIPITQTPVSPLADALDVAARTMGQMVQSDRQAMQQVDAVNHQLAVKRQQDEDNALLLQQAAKWAETEGRIAVRIDEARRQHGPGGAGHVKSVQDIIAEEQTAFDAGFGQNERVRQRYTDNVAQTAARYETREIMYASDQFAKNAAQNGDSFIAATGNGLQIKPDDDKFRESLAMWSGLTKAMPMNEDAQTALYKKGEAELWGKYLTGLTTNGRYEDANKLIHSGGLNGIIDDVKPYLRSIEIERNEAARAVQEAAMLRREEARETAKQIDVRIDGGEIIDPQAMSAAAARMRAAGVKESEVIAFENKTVEARVNQTYNPQVDPMGTQASMAAQMLETKIFSGKASADEERRYKHLKKVADTRATEFGKSLKPTAAQGVQGKQAVLGQLAALPADQRYTAAEAAAPGLGQVAMIRFPVVQEAALQGMADLKANMKLIDAGKADAAFRAATRTAGQQLSEDGRQQMIGVANGLYVHWLGSGAAGQEFNPTLYQKAVRMAYGGYTKDGEWHGGLGLYRGRSVELPDDYTDKKFDRVVSRMTFADAVYADKSAASKADVLQNYTPIFLRDDPDTGRPVYGFVNSNGDELKHKNGSAYVATMP